MVGVINVKANIVCTEHNFTGSWTNYSSSQHSRNCSYCGEKQYASHNKTAYSYEPLGFNVNHAVNYRCSDCGYSNYDKGVEIHSWSSSRCTKCGYFASCVQCGARGLYQKIYTATSSGAYYDGTDAGGNSARQYLDVGASVGFYFCETHKNSEIQKGSYYGLSSGGTRYIG